MKKFATEEWMQDFRPSRVLHYFDRLRIYVKRPASKEWLGRLERDCGNLNSRLGPAWFDPRYQQRLEIFQPSPAALLQLAELPDDAMLCYAEVACDVVVPDEYSLQNLMDAFLAGFLQPHHRNKEPEIYVDGSGRPTGFTTRKPPQKGARRQGFWFQFYIDRPCRITGDPHCFHFEGKHESRRALKRLGIHHPRDLQHFDFCAYFKKRASKLYQIDYERLGRWDHNRRNGRKRKKPHIDERNYNSDRTRGYVLYQNRSLHAEGNHRSLQTFVVCLRLIPPSQYLRGSPGASFSEFEATDRNLLNIIISSTTEASSEARPCAPFVRP